MPMKAEVNSTDLKEFASLLPSRLQFSQFLTDRILLHTEGDQLQISWTDLKVNLIRTFNADIQEPGSIIINSQAFLRIIQALSLIPLQISSDKENCKISVGKARFKLPVFPEEDYPEWPKFQVEASAQITAADFREVLRKTVFVLDLRHPNTYGSSIYMEFTNSTNQILKIFSADGRRLSKINLLCSELKGEKKILLSFDAIRFLRKFLKAWSNSDITLWYGEGSLAIGQKGNLFQTQLLLDEMIPNYEGVLNENQAKLTKTLLLDSESLASALRRLYLLDMDQTGIEFSISENQLRLSVGDNHETFPIDFPDESFDFRLNPIYALQFLNSIESEKVQLRFGPPGNAIEFQGNQEKLDYVHILMPVRSSE